LFATTSFVATSLLAGAGALTTAALTPSMAFAACTGTSGLVPCSTGAYTTGIQVTPTGNGTTVIVQDDTVTNTTNLGNGDGIFVGNTSSSYNMGVVFADPNNGVPPFTTVSGNATGTNGYGIEVQSGGGNVSVSTDDYTTAPFTINVDEPNTVTGKAGIVIGTTGNGAGNVTIGGLDTITGTNGPGIATTTFGGATAVNVLAGAKVSGSFRDVFSQSLTGSITDVIDGNLTTSGLLDQTGANGTIGVTLGSTGSVNNSNGSAIVTTAGNGATTVDASGAISAASGYGIDSSSSGNGTISITTHPGGTITGAALGTTGIHAVTSGGAAISITTGDVIGNATTAMGDEGIFAQVGNTTGNAGGDLNVYINGNIYSQNTGVDLENDQVGGNIHVTTSKGYNVNTKTSDGIDAKATHGGSVTVNLLDGAINANTSHASGVAPAMSLSAVGAGKVLVNAQDTQTNFNGAGDITTTVDGTNEVGISAAIDNNANGVVPGDAVNASSSGTGDVIVSGFTGVSGNVTTPDSGEQLAGGTVQTDAGPVILTKGEGVSGVITEFGGADINATTSGSGNVTVQTIAGGKLEGNATVGGATDGVFAEANTGNVTVNIGDSIADTGPAAITTGVNASIQNAKSTGSVNVTVAGNVTGADTTGLLTINAGNYGVFDENLGKGDATTSIGADGYGVTINSQIGTYAFADNGNATNTVGKAVTVNASLSGVVSQSVAKTALVTTGGGDTVHVDVPDGVGSLSSGSGSAFYSASGAAADSGGPSADVELGGNTTISVTSTVFGHIDGATAIAAVNNASGSGSAQVKVGDGLNLTMTGDDNVGVLAQTSSAAGLDKGGVFDGSGNATIVVGAGNITLLAGNGTDISNQWNASVGELASSGKGSASVTNGANITVSNTSLLGSFGIVSIVDDFGAGAGTAATISNSGAVTSNNGAGLLAQNAGAGSVSVTNTGNVTSNTGQIANTGDAILAVSNSGKVEVNGNGTLTVATGGGDGIDAVSTKGSVYVGDVGGGYAGDINTTTGAGVFAKTGDTGLINVLDIGNITTTSGDGIDGNATGTGNVTIQYGSPGNTAITINAGGNGIDGVAAGGGVAITNYGTVNSGTDGVYAIVGANTGGKGSVTVTTSGNNTGGGIGAFNTSATGATTVTILGNATTTASPGSTHAGVTASGAGAGLVTVDGNASGTITSDASDGVDATNSGTGGVYVATGNLANIVATKGNGIVALETAAGGAGGVTVLQNGAIGGNLAPVGFSGVVAQITQAKDSGNVLVTSNADIYGNGNASNSAGNLTYGIYAGTVGAGSVTITATSNKVIDPVQYGQFGTAAGGPLTITSNDIITANEGLHGDNSGAGTISIFQTTGGSIDALGGNGTSGNGIEATETALGGYGAITVGNASTPIVGNITALTADGVNAAGGGSVSVYTGLGTILGNTTTGHGISAVSSPVAGNGNVGGPVFVSTTGTTIKAGTGILGQNLGNLTSNTTTVTTDAATAITSTAGDGIGAFGINGATNVLNNGTIDTTGGDGIDAQNHAAGNGATGDVFVNGSGAITVRTVGDTGGAGILLRSDLGNLTVGNLAPGYNGAINNLDGANGIDAQITNKFSTGDIGITTGAGGTIGGTKGDSTLNGIYAVNDGGNIFFTNPGGGAGNVSVTVGGDIGDGAAMLATGVTAQVNNIASQGNVTVHVLTGVNITAVGDGVFATTSSKFTSDPSAGGGEVVVNQDAGAGTITSIEGNGIKATNTSATKTGTGTVTVNQDANVVTDAGTGVYASSTGQGDVTVNQGAAATITAVGGDGIDSIQASGKNGNAIVDAFGSTTATGVGIFATSNTNDNATVTLESGAHVEGGSAGAGGSAGDGILASYTGKDKFAGVQVTVLGNATIGNGAGNLTVGNATGGNGIEVTSTGPGAISVTTNQATNIWALGDGILATENFNGASEDLLIQGNGTINAAGVGIDAEVTKAANPASVTVYAGNITSDGDGVKAFADGGGPVTVTTLAGTTITSIAGDGVNAEASGGNGSVLVNNNANVFGDAGIYASATGTGTVTVNNKNANVSAGNSSIQTVSVDGNNTVNIIGAGSTITSTGSSPGDDGINAITTGAGSVMVTTAAGTTVSGGTSAGGDDGIFATVGAVGGGGITIITAGNTATGLTNANNWAIHAQGEGGTIEIKNSGTVTGGILASNQVAGGTATITTSGNVTNAGADAIAILTTTGQAQVNLNGNAVVQSTVADGVDLTTTSGPIVVTGNSTGTQVSGQTNGIAASSTAAGAINISDQGSITGVTGSGVLATDSGGDGNIAITTGGNVTGAVDGISATTGNGGEGLGTININSTGPGLVSSTGVGPHADGIAAATDLGNITITTGAVTSANGEGVEANVAGGAGSIVITDVGAVSGKTFGVDANTSGGSGLINIHTESTVTATGPGGVSDTGINAIANTGSVTVLADGLVSADVINGIGINAASNGGNISVTAKNGVTGGADGLGVGIKTATSGLGVTTVTTTGGQVTGDGDGIASNTSGGGSITTTTSGVSGIGLGANGIKDTSSGGSTITISAGGAIAGDATAGGGGLGGNGIYATSTGGNGLISITTTGGAGSTVTGGNGIVAATGNGVGTGTGNISISTSGGDAVTSTGASSLAVGIGATTDLGNITITSGAVSSTSGTGIAAATNGAAPATTVISITNDGVVSGVTGISAAATAAGGAASISITANAAVNGSVGGDGIDAKTNTGAISVTTNAPATVSGANGILTSVLGGAGTTTINSSGGLVTGLTADGVHATTAGSGLISITTGAVTATSAGGEGVFAQNGSGGAGNIIITANGAIQGGKSGIDANDTVGSTGNITVTNFSTVSGNVGISATAGSGGSTVNADGAVTGANGDGINATSQGAGPTNVTSGAGDDVTSLAGGVGINATSVTGPVKVTTGGVTSGALGGINGASGGGAVTVTAEDDVIGNAGTGVTAASTGGNGNVQVITTSGATVTGINGIVASSTNGGAGTGSVKVDTTLGGLVTGNGPLTSSVGISGATDQGNVTITTGDVTDTNGTGVAATIGSAAAPSSALITVTTSGGSIAGGLYGINANDSAGAGGIVVTSGVVNSANGTGINATAGTSGVLIDANGPVTGGNVAINATSTGAGPTKVVTSGVISSGGNMAINASSVTGNVSVITDNTVTGNTTGIVTSTGGTGTTTINTQAGGLVKGLNGDGIDAFTTATPASSGLISITTGAVTGTVNGVVAQSGNAPPAVTTGSSSITITNNGAVSGGTGEGIGAFTNGAGVITLNVNGTVSGGVGISTVQTGTGSTTIIDGLPANTITGTTGDGIQSVNGLGTGAVNVGVSAGQRLIAPVSGFANGIDISGSGPMNVWTDADVTGGADGGNGWGIIAQGQGTGAGSPVTVDTLNGTITGNGNATSPVGGIAAWAKAGGSTNTVSVTNNDNIVATTTPGVFSKGIDAEGELGNVTVTSGSTVSGLSITAGGTGIYASAAGGAINVGGPGGINSSFTGMNGLGSAGIQTANSGAGTTTILTDGNASMATLNNADFGIEAATSGTGLISITSASQIGNATGGGVHSAGIFASETGADTAGIVIANTGNITVNGAAPDRVGIATSTYGIYGYDAGVGDIKVTNSGVIDPPDIGIFMETGGNVTLANTGNITANVVGVSGYSNTGQNVTIASSGAAAFITGTGGDGIDALSFGPFGSHGVVQVGNATTPITSDVSGGYNGIVAEGQLTVSVYASGNVTGTNEYGIFAESYPNPTNLPNASVFVSTGPGAVLGEAGILAATNGVDTTDAVTVNVGGNVTSTDGIAVEADGINALTNVNLNAGNVSATGGDGILGNSTGTGGVLVTSATGTTVTVNTGITSDIVAQSSGASGNVVVNNAAVLTATGGNNNGILAQTTATSVGNVTVTNTGNISANSAPFSNGIVAQVVGGAGSTGVVNVDNEAGNVTASDTGVAGFSNGAGSVSVTSGATAPGNVTGGYIGLYGEISNPANSAALTITTGAANGSVADTITGNGGTQFVPAFPGAGIFARTNGTGNITVTSNAGTTILAPNNDGIYALNSAGASGNVTVNSGAVIGTGGSVIGNIGVYAAIANNSSTGAVTVTSSGPITVASTAGTIGIDALTNGTGAVNVTNSGAITDPRTGIVAIAGNATLTDGGSSTVTNSASITAVTSDIVAKSTGAGAVTVASTGPTTLYAGSTYGIDAESVGGTVTVGTVGVPIASTINAGTAGVFTKDTSGPTVIATSGSVTGGVDGVDANSGSGSITVTTTGNVQGNTTTGILANSGSGAVVVNSGTSTLSHQTITAGTYGIQVNDTGGPTTITNYDNIVGVTAGGPTAGGINVNGGAGSPISITNAGDMSTLNGAIYGIYAADTTGQIIVSNTANLGAAGAGAGIETFGIGAQSTGANTGGITVFNSGNIYTQGISNELSASNVSGIWAINAGTGFVHITNQGTIDPGAYGIYGSSGGSSTVDNTGASVTGGIGIHDDSQGGALYTAQVNVGNATVASVVTGTTGNGVEVFGNNAGANVGVNATQSGAITGATNGIVTQTSGTGTTFVDTLNPTPAAQALTLGQGGDGIDATTSGSGLVTVITGKVTGQGAAGHISSGILASSAGGSNISVTTTGDITGDQVGNAAGINASGIQAATQGGNGNVSVDVNAITISPFTSSVSGGDRGIGAASVGAGHTTVTVGGAGANLVTVTATGAVGVNGAGAQPANAGSGPVGIAAVGGTGSGGLTNGVTVTTYSNVTAAHGRAILTNSGGNASINIDDDQIGFVLNQTVIKGLGDATVADGGTSLGNFSHAVIDVTTATGSTTTINNNGLVESVNGPGVASYGDLALKAQTGGVTVNNNAGGTILGRIIAGNVTTADAVTVNNASGGTWHTTGISTLGAGVDSVNNSGYIGTAANATTTTINFSGNAANAINNTASGVIVAGESPLAGTAAAPAVTNITGNVTFTNNGLLVLGGYSGGSDGAIDSVVNGAAGTTIGGTGIIALDANLWSTTQSAANCAAFSLTAADCLIVHGSTGNEGIRVTDTYAHALGAYNPTGIVIVSGSSSASTFHLDPGSSWFNTGGGNNFGGATNILDKPGLFFYDLAYNAGDATERLISVPKLAAFEFASLGGATNDVWYTTTQVWFDRQADLRDTLEGRPNDSKPGVWLKVVGDFTDRNATDVYTDFNKSYAFNVSYKQDTADLIGGVDLLNVTEKDRAWVVGLQGGSIDSNIDFKASPDAYHLTGGDIGIYGTWLSHGLFIDGTLNANLLSMRGTALGLRGTQPALPNLAVGDKITSVGGQLEGGYEMPLGASMFWEPLGTLAYVNTKLTDIPVYGGVQSMGHADSFRGSLGARLGTTMSYQYYKLKFSVTGRIWDEFDNNTISSLAVLDGPNFYNNDNLHGVFGDISGQANLFSTTSGLSAFVNGGVKFKSNYTDGTVTLGARYQW
jgi:hypothetical protein